MKRIGIALALGVFALIASAMSGKATEADLYYQCLVDSTSGSQVVGWCPVGSKYPLPITSSGGNGGVAPYSFTHLGGAQYNLAIVTAQFLTVPAGALFATVLF